MSEMTRRETLFVLLLAAWLVFSTSVVTLLVFPSRHLRAMLGMGWGLILLWIFLGGGLMWRYRKPLRDRVLALRLDWRLKFILFATLLALIEEAITTTMTNLAPVFGVKIGQAYITASTNYLDVVFMHSVIIFISMFVGWAWLLSRYDFRPFAVFVLFGLTGTLAETSFGGPAHLREFGLWIFVYGLMVYLPAYSLPPDRNARAPRWWHYLLAIFVPFLFLILVPLALIPHLLSPHHPKIHFPPITP